MRTSSSFCCGTRLLPLALAALLPSQRVFAQTISKANNTTALISGGSWVGGVAPGASNVAQWDSTVTAANSVAIGGNLTVQGMAVTNPGGNVTINATTGATLTLGSSGIAMGNATQPLSITPPVALSASQTWTGSAGNGTLTLAGGVNLGGNQVTISDNASSKVQFKAGLDTGTVVFATASSGLQVPSMVSGTNWTAAFNGSGAGTALDLRATLTVSGVIAMTGGISVNSASSVVTVNNAGNSFPRLSVPAGTVAFGTIAAQGAGCAIGTGATVTSLGFTNNTGKLQYTGATATTNRGFSRDGRGSGAIEVAAPTTTLTIAGNLMTTTPTGAAFSPGWQFGGAGTLVLGGVISDGNTTFTTAVTKYGTGAVKLTAANTYTAGTTVSAGTLLVDNSSGSGTGSGAVAVGASGVLSGNGSIAGAVSFASGGSLQPGVDAGVSAGRLTFTGGLDLTNATVTLEVFGPGGTAGSDFDQIAVNAAFNWGGANVAIVAANAFALTTTSGSYRLLAATTTTGSPQSVTVNGRALTANGSVWSGLIDGSTISFDAGAGVLTVTPPPPIPPTITQQPADASVPEGGSTVFTVAASYAKTFQWRFNGVALAGATSAAYPVTNALSANAGKYDVVVTNDYGSTTSTAATLTLTVALPAISTAPVGASGAVGQVIALSVVAAGADQYQWRKDGVAIPNATTATLTLTNAQPADIGSYDVVLTNLFGSTTSQAVNVNVLGKLTTVVAGSTQPFDADAGGASYSWQLDGSAAITTGPEYVYQPDTTDAGTHWLVVDQVSAAGGHTRREWAIKVTVPLPDTTPVNYYVAPGGNDANPGTGGAPFQTLEAARNALRALPRPLPAGGATVWLRGGTYYRSATFTLTSADTGTADAPIIYRAYPGETPVISGGKPQPAARFSPLRSDQWSRVAPGVDPQSIVELDLSVAGIVNKGPLPAGFGSWVTYNTYYASVSGKLCEVLFNGKRMYLSRYPNHDLTNDNLNTQNLAMNGVVQGTLADGTTNYLNYGGTYTYTDATGQHAVATGGAFQYRAADAAHVARWTTALANGGLWLQGYWRVPWQVNGAKVTAIDTTNGVIMLDPAAAVANGIGNKYARSSGSPSYGAGNKAEPYWVLNLLEEIDQPGEWAIDFNRNVLYFLPPAPITDNGLVISDLAAPLVQTNATNYTYFRGLTFEAGLAAGIQILNSTRDLVVGCTFRNMNNYPVDINGGTANGVVSNDLVDLGGGGVFLQGGDETANPRVPARHFVVNNRIVNFAVNARVYAGAIDSGFGGESQGTGGGDHLQAVGMRIANNFISTSPHGGVLHGSWDSTFEYNELTQWCQFSDDLGGFYSYDNIGRHGNQTFRYNFMHDSPHGDAIYFDHDHPYMHVYGNVFNLNTLPSESRGMGFELRVETSATSLDPQTVDIHDNLIVNGHLAGDMFMALPSVMQNNAYVLTTKPWNWQQITLVNGTSKATASNASVLASGPNPGYSADPGFLNLAGNDLRLNPTSTLFTDMPGFTPAPFELIGLFNDGIRTDATTTRAPLVSAAAVTAVTTNSALASATLAYPQFEANTAVSVLWAPTDGGTDAAQWANRQDLGLSAAGAQTAPLSGLQPGASYVVRFLATNSAGQSWSAPATFTTLAPPTFTSAATLGGVYGSALQFQVAVSANPVAAITASDLPPGLQFDPTSGVLSGTPVAAGAYTVTLVASNAVGTATLPLTVTIAKAPAVVAFGSLTQVYAATPLAPTTSTAPAHLAVALSFDGSPALPSRAGTYGVTATVTDPNYTGSATAVFVIGKAIPRIGVAGYSTVYDANPHGATGSVTGVAGEPLGGLDLSGTVHTAAGSYEDSWVFTDTTGNYLDAAAMVTDFIGRATPAITVTAYHVTYDASAHLATGSATGVRGEALTGLDLTATVHSDAGTYHDQWRFVDGTGNYANASATIADQIDKATATVALSPLAQWYDGTPRSVAVTTSPAGLSVTVTYNGGQTVPVAPGSYLVSGVVSDPNYRGELTDTLKVSLAALVNHGVSLTGQIDGSLQVLSAEDDTLSGTALIARDLLAPGLPVVNLTGKPTYGGTLDFTGTAVTPPYAIGLSGRAVLRHVVRRVDPQPLPAVELPPVPAGSSDVVIDDANLIAGDFGTVNNLAVQGSASVALAIPPGVYGKLMVAGQATVVLGVAGSTTPAVYAFDSVQLSGHAQVKLVGPVVLTVAHGASVQIPLGSSTHPDWLTVQVAAGDATFTGGATIYGTIIAPKGTVALTGNATLVGALVADRLTVDGSSVVIEPDLAVAPATP